MRGGNDKVTAIFEPKFNWASKNVELTAKATTSSDYEGNKALLFAACFAPTGDCLAAPFHLHPSR